MSMNSAVFAGQVRNILSALEINVNRSMGREFVPITPSLLHIETSSACNLKCCFCAYVKKQSPKISMKNDFFKNCIDQAVDMGFRRLEMTPCTGDVFMDRHIFEKLEYLEQKPELESYQFFTNFTIPKPDHIELLLRLKKLKHLSISIYGHDLDSFVAITKSTEKVYKRLLSNLEYLLERLDRRTFKLDIGFRSTRDAPRGACTDLLRLLERFKRTGIPVRRSRLYNNWGGLVTQDDMKGLAIDITDANAVYKNGACALLFNRVQIMATGIVNGCACRDAEATLRIGDMNKQPLCEILSNKNATYMNLIEEQQRGEFRPVCKSCDFYKSIYHFRSIYADGAVELRSIEQFKISLDRPVKAAS